MNEEYMSKAIKEAKKAFKYNDVPVGAVAVKDGKIVAKAHNTKHKKKNTLMHAEIILINKLCKKYKDWRLENIDIYVTLEPCMMCMGAILSSRINNLYYGCESVEKSYSFTNNFHTNIYKGILDEECKNILQEFFKNRRLNSKKIV